MTPVGTKLLIAISLLLGACTSAIQSDGDTTLSLVPNTTTPPTTNASHLNAPTSIAPTTTPTTTTDNTDPKPSTTVAGTQAAAPVQLPALGENVWWMAIPDQPGRIVESDPNTGEITRELWLEEPTEDSSSGNTVVCEADQEAIPLVSLSWELRGPTKEILYERREVDGVVVSEQESVVDGATAPRELNEVCGELRFPIIRVTALQLGALLDTAGFTQVAGDHAIDPVWEASGSWDGIEYVPINLYQGEIRPEPNNMTEVLECRMGALQLTTSLPAEARSALVRHAGC